eukprot:191614-Chlamydomonas_euryale.AAC.10
MWWPCSSAWRRSSGRGTGHAWTSMQLCRCGLLGVCGGVQRWQRCGAKERARQSHDARLDIINRTCGAVLDIIVGWAGRIWRDVNRGHCRSQVTPGHCTSRAQSHWPHHGMSLSWQRWYGASHVNAADPKGRRLLRKANPKGRRLLRSTDPEDRRLLRRPTSCRALHTAVPHSLQCPTFCGAPLLAVPHILRCPTPCGAPRAAVPHTLRCPTSCGAPHPAVPRTLPCPTRCRAPHALDAAHACKMLPGAPTTPGWVGGSFSEVWSCTCALPERPVPAAMPRMHAEVLPGAPATARLGRERGVETCDEGL